MNRVASLGRLAVVAGLLIPSLLFASDHWRKRKYTPPPPVAKITVTVTAAFNGKPVQNAAVVFHPINAKGKDKGGLELKTDENGKATLDLIPIGDRLLLQVIANGYQTFGNIYQIDGKTRQIAIKLRFPAQQYSIYRNNSNGQIGGVKTDEKRAPRTPGQPPGTSE